PPALVSLLFLSTAPAPPLTYPLSLHDALPISPRSRRGADLPRRSPGLPWPRSASPRGRQDPPAPRPLRQGCPTRTAPIPNGEAEDRKSTRLNSSHLGISYAVFCLKKKKKPNNQ